jgi:hypothetical protein
MNKQIGLTTLAIVLSVHAWSDPVKPGHYVGKAISVIKAMNGSTWVAEVKVKNGETILDTKRELMEYSEEWVWNDQTLVKKDFGWAALGGRKVWGKTAKAYHATNDAGKYRIDCKDRAAGDCDGEMEPNHYWVITGTEEGFKCESWGTPKGKPGEVILFFTVNYQPEPK